MEGKLHVYYPKRDLLLFEHTPQPPQSTTPSSSSIQPTSSPPNTLLFVGGMYDNFLNPSYTTTISSLLPRHPSQTWNLMHVQLTSAGRAFGTSTLDKDIDEIATAITYVRTNLRPNTPGHIVLLGHSTGCQDVLHYLSAPNPNTTPFNQKAQPRPQVQGAILQAPVSDRDALLHAIATKPDLRSHYDKAISIATATPVDQHSNIILPLNLTGPLFASAPLTITRFLSLASPNSPLSPGPDDLFSQDASEYHLLETFGRIGKRNLLHPAQNNPSLLALISGADEYVPADIDKAALLAKWRAAMEIAPVGDNGRVRLHEKSRAIAHARHGLSGGKGEQVWAKMVEFREVLLRYLDEVVGGVEDESWRIWRADREDLRKQFPQLGGSGEEKGWEIVEKGISDVKL